VIVAFAQGATTGFESELFFFFRKPAKSGSLLARAGRSSQGLYVDRKDKTQINLETSVSPAAMNPRPDVFQSLAHPKPHGCPVLTNHLPRNTFVAAKEL